MDYSSSSSSSSSILCVCVCVSVIEENMDYFVGFGRCQFLDPLKHNWINLGI